jgi:hypothetical protein
MNRFWVHLATGLTTMVGITVIVSACAHDDSSFFLQNVLAPPPGASSTGCFFTDDPTQDALFEGFLDVEAVASFSDSYQAVFLAGNQLISTANAAQLMTETDDIVIQGAVVTITDAANNQLNYYTTLGAGFAYAANGSTPGYGPVEFTIVDPQTIDALRNKLSWLERETIVTYTKAFGTTLGGDHVESNTFEYPITVCKGCLITYDTNPDELPIPNCFGPVPTGATGPTVCFFGQDASFDCHDCISDPYCLCGAAAGSATPNVCTAVVAGDGGT